MCLRGIVPRTWAGVDVLFGGTPVSVLFCYSLALQRYTYCVMCSRTDDDGLSLHAFVETLDPSCLYDLLAIAAGLAHAVLLSTY